MKNYFALLTLLFVSSFSFSYDSEEPTHAGDNLDLEAVLNLFEKSKSIEDFEKELNSEKNDINNLDLNNDGFVDYIRVIDYTDGKTHSLTLQVPYSDTESQDVAVILIEETGDEDAVVQIVGDEDLYGEDHIIEPGSEGSDEVTNVYHWTPIRHIYGPKYVVWVSPWRYKVYPKWYRPWKPVSWTIYHNRVRHHHVPCRKVKVYRSHHAHTNYHKHRVHSKTYHTHHKTHNNAHHQKTGGNVNKTSSSKKKASTQKRSSEPMKSSGRPTKRPGGTKRSGGR